MLDWIDAVKRQGHEVVLLTPKVRRPILPEIWKTLKVITIPYPRLRGGYRLFDWLSARAVTRELRSGRYDWAYCRITPSFRLAAVMKNFQVPWAIELNGAETFGLPAFKAMADGAALLLVDSEAVCRMVLESTGKPEESVAIHPHSAIAARRFEALDRNECRAEFGLADGETCLTNVSAFMSHHDHLTLLRAAELLTARGRRTRLLLAGEGPLLAQVRKNASSMKDVEVSFLGSVSPLGLPRLLAASDVCFDLLTREKLLQGNLRSQKLNEYAAAARPAVVAVDRTLPIAEWARECLALVPPEDPEAVAEVTESILDNPVQWDEKARKARQFVLENRTWDKAAEQTLKHLKAALHRDTRPLRGDAP